MKNEALPSTPHKAICVSWGSLAAFSFLSPPCCWATTAPLPSSALHLTEKSWKWRRCKDQEDPQALYKLLLLQVILLQYKRYKAGTVSPGEEGQETCSSCSCSCWPFPRPETPETASAATPGASSSIKANREALWEQLEWGFVALFLWSFKFLLSYLL